MIFPGSATDDASTNEHPLTTLLKEIVALLIDPMNVIVGLGLLSILLYFKKKIRWAKNVLLGLIVFFLLTASSPLPDYLISRLEQRYPSFNDFTAITPDEEVDILVLGSGHTADPDLPATDKLSATALQRLAGALRIYQQIPQSRLIVSGYGDESALSQAEILREAAISLGVAGDRVIIQKEPTTTAEEAKFYRQRFGPDRTLVLVTSATHMPRAIYLFTREGLKPMPAPTGHLVKKDPDEPVSWDLFSARNFQKMETAMHEYIGMLWAKR